MTTPPTEDAQLVKLTAAAASWLRPDGISTADDVVLGLVAPAVAVFVDSLPAGGRNAAGLWTAQTQLGAVMLSARLVRRRNSPAGIATFTTEGGVAYVTRFDPDVAQLLELGASARPQTDGPRTPRP